MLAFLNKKRTGETLLEILIALFVLGTTSSAATFMIIQSNRASTDIQKNFQARYLAREVFEHLKMVRDTNWIRFGDKSCWDVQLGVVDCGGGKRMTDESPYALIAKTDITFMYFDLSPVVDADNAIFKNCTASPTLNNPYNVYVHQKKDAYEGFMYTPDPITAPPPNQIPGYCRQVKLTRILNSTQKGPDTIEVEVHIGWKSGGQIHDRKYISLLNP